MLDENTNTLVPPQKPRSLHINCDAIEPRFQHNVSPISTQPTLSPSSIFSAEEEPKRNQSNIFYILSKLKHLTNPFRHTHTKHQHRISEKSRGKMAMQLEGSNSDKVVRHSYSDPRLSPGSTAVGDEEDPHRLSYFTIFEKKKKRSTRRWLITGLMILFGALIAVTFVLVGLGKAAGNQSTKTQTSMNTTASENKLQPSYTTSITISSHLSHPTLTSQIMPAKSITNTVTKVLTTGS